MLLPRPLQLITLDTTRSTVSSASETLMSQTQQEFLRSQAPLQAERTSRTSCR